MATTPFIRPVQLQGGTFYSFSSAAQDLNFTFNNDGKKFSFSKYVLLNIPDIKRPTLGPLNYENFVQFDNIPGAFEYVNNSKSQNMMLAESFENYVLNLETMVTSFPSYNSSQLNTISERVFFKWLKEIGALRFRQANTNETPLTTGMRFVEEDPSISYNRVVQYIGQIDVVNSVKNQADAYSSLYIHVPTKDGATPLILFESINDNNYFPGQNLINVPTDPLNTSYLKGRNYFDTNPAGLDIHAFFDSTSGTYGAGLGLPVSALPVITLPGEYQLLKYDIASSSYLVNWWFEFAEANSYWTQPPAISGTFDDPGNDSLMLRGVKDGTSSSLDIFFQRSRLDGISIDFNVNSYLPITSNPSLSSFSDFNGSANTVSFEFNAVLVYYDVQDIANPSNTTTNLFGILFLNDALDNVSGGGTITRLEKFKPNRITGLNGNSYGFNINLKFDVNTEDTAITTSINEYAPFSMQLFVDALNQLQGASDTLTGQTSALASLKTSVENLSDTVYNSQDITSILDRITTLESQIANGSLLLENSSTIMDLIQRNYNEILNIYNNQTSVTVAYNTDTIQQGAGILLDKSTPNKIVINNVEQAYSFNASPIFNIITSFTNTPSAWTNIIPLNTFANYMKISNGASITFDRDVNIYIDDSLLRWSPGQSFKIIVDNLYPMDMYSSGSFDLVVYTDAIDRLSSGQIFSSEIARISSSDFYANNGTPSIEIICIDTNSYSFTFDLL